MSSETVRAASSARRPPRPFVSTRPGAPRARAASHASLVRSTSPDIEMTTTRSAGVRCGASYARNGSALVARQGRPSPRRAARLTARAANHPSPDATA